MIILPAVYRGAGLAMAGVGLLMLAGAGYLILQPVQPVDESAVMLQKNKECKAAAEGAGFVTQDIEDGKIMVSRRGLMDYQYSLGVSAFVVSECDAYTMTQYCMGQSCGDDKVGRFAGTQMVLSVNPQNRLDK